ncbi:phage tail component protein [Enterococcus faecalis D811610-10]|uniref:GntR family transcriptional regulator n=1 Tax=Bacillus anthracis TaxID=1392 RepID=A0A640MI06_BACAN|nr:DnaD domain protein [Enterococcus faecalis]GEU13694.1 GntR family transcriptional regulator [Bacillus anthracis]EGO8295998.1 DnaD domain protein [Enterococcus faecalis]EIA0405806.1 DnaD domain protein [Enterococcus faecalis]EOJ55219.1 DnaD domain-containing protein [Enterococcus faecalis EnGen0363]EPH75449.1 phage tail component protein [Enterococcus faecalis D811610-10]
MNAGYVKLYRKVMDSFVWTNPYMYKLWNLCLMKASHENRKFLFNGKEIWLNSGEFVTGRDAITFEMNKGVKREHQVNSGSVWRWLKRFEKEGMLNIKSTTKYSVVSINNWDDYQASEHQVNIKRTTSEQQVHTYKNEKNDKNEKNVVVVEEQQSVFQLYQSIFGMLNSVTTQNLEYWCNDLSTELVSEALKISAKSNARNFKYTESILRNWEQEGVKTLDDVKALAVKRERTTTKQQKSNTGHSDYDDLGF